MLSSTIKRTLSVV
uniref:Uncharacterized protein n=1 Tax=Anguilla anguilla TaxID=7936 RepID=A0A0E9UZ41_ANGAN